MSHPRRSTIIMNRGKPILSWTEPDTWRQAANAHAKKEGNSTFPWQRGLVTLGLVCVLLTWEWMDADPNTRVSVPLLICMILILFGFIVGIGCLHYMLNSNTKTTVYERGLVHGSLTKKQWVPWADMEYFYVDEDSVGQWTFRFLSWSRVGVDDEDFSVIPDDADLDVAVRYFKSNEVEQVVAPDVE